MLGREPRKQVTLSEDLVAFARFAEPRAGSGKSGGVRVIYFNRLANGEIWLLFMCAKAKLDSSAGEVLRKVDLMILNNPLTDEALDFFESSFDIAAERRQSVKEMIAKKGTKDFVSPVVSARIKSGLSQSQFAGLLGVSVPTLQEWEQGRRSPSKAAQTLITIAERRPDVLREVAAAAV